MAEKNRQTGLSAKEWTKKRNLIIGEIVLLAISAVAILYLLLKNVSVLGIGGASIVILFVVLRYVPGIFGEVVEKKNKEEKRAIRGAIAEEKVGETLAGLPAEYYVLNDIRSPYGAIDYVVIGKSSGVFLIETKAQGGTVKVEDDLLLVNGKQLEKNLIPRILQKTAWLADQITQIVGSKPWVTPLLAFNGAKVVPGKSVKGIGVVTQKTLRNAIKRVNKPSAVHAQVWKQRELIETRLG